ncbi:jg2244 [Pararge aegeria aegeria]|uniref:Jg2244 protein n=1 Tax=Pararge aegeria aegeria TaxID=348720 RepID=A0A8S4SHB5_9NEOP|nr:jg2244 [Pararge aegeria aegeria]
MGVTDSPLCRASLEADETPKHVLLECTGVAYQRKSTWDPQPQFWKSSVTWVVCEASGTSLDGWGSKHSAEKFDVQQADNIRVDNSPKMLSAMPLVAWKRSLHSDNAAKLCHLP